MPSPFAQVAARYRENGYSVMPAMPGTKIPGAWEGGAWKPMPAWTRYCEAPAAPFVFDRWLDLPDAGICIAHGRVIGLDLDTDRADVAAALHGAVTPSPVRRRGGKGWMAYYRAGSGLGDLTARVRWYDTALPDAPPCVELLLHGTQSILPPTIHPDTGRPYQWTTPDTFETVEAHDLPELTGDDVARLDAAFAAIGLARQAPRRVERRGGGMTIGISEGHSPSGHDLDKPFGRSVNDRAMEAIDAWWPAMGLPKTRQRGPGAWEAVAVWRASGSGRAHHDRNPNLKATPHGIVDFGADRSYTPVDVVMAWRDCSFEAAVEWLTPYLRPEEGRVDVDLSAMAMARPAEEALPPVAPPQLRAAGYSVIPAIPGEKSFGRILPVASLSAAEYDALVPEDPGPFPVPSYGAIGGLLGLLAGYIDDASATATDAGALAVALPLLGALIGKAYETPTSLRANIYTAAIGGSGSGKTSLVAPAKELLLLAKSEHVLGSDRIASGTGLLRMLDAGPKVCFLDEFGHMLKQIGSPGSGVHAKQIITEFTALYSAANTLFTGTAYATMEARAIYCPHLCLFGMATPDQFWGAFSSGAMEDGSIARYLVLPIGDSAPKQPDLSMQSYVIEAIQNLQSAVASRRRGNLDKVEALRVPITDDAERARLALISTMDACARHAEGSGIRGAGPILRRVAENAAKIALVAAVGRDPVAPVISSFDFDIGHAVARWSATSMIANIASRIADNQHERDVNDVERFVKEGGAQGRDWRAVQRAFRRIKARDLREIVEALEREGSISIDVETAPGGRWPVKTLRAA